MKQFYMVGIIILLLTATTELSYGLSITLSNCNKLPSDSVVRVQFLDRQHGFVSTVESTIWQTVDGGKSWKEIYKTPIEDGIQLSDFTFLNKDDGYILLNDNSLYRFCNINKKWSTKKISVPSDNNVILARVFFDSKGEAGYLFGGVKRSPTTEEVESDIVEKYTRIGNYVIEPSIYFLKGQGKSWERVNKANNRLGIISNVSVNSMMLGIAVGHETSVFVTGNIGGKWLDIDSLNPQYALLVDSGQTDDKYVSSLFYLDNSNIWIAYRNGNIDKICIDKCKPGNTKPGKKNFSYFKLIQFFNKSEGIALDGISGKIYSTSDGGNSWKMFGSESWHTFYFLSKGEGWFVDQKGQFYSAKIK